MVDQVGGIEYQVAADVAPLLKSARDVDAATDGMTQSFNQTDKAVDGLNTTVKQMPQAVNRANSSLSSLRGIAQQAGFQLQDVAVQAQAGTAALTIIGQQGSQFASVFGPAGAVVGAIIAVASALGSVLFNSSEKAGEGLNDLRDDAIELEDALRSLSLFKLNEELDQVSESIESQRKELARLQSSPDPYRNLVEDISNAEAEVVQLETLQQRIIDQIDRVIKKTDEKTDEDEKNADSVDRLIEGLNAQAAAIQTVDGALVKSARAQALYVATQKGATKAQLDDINAAFDRIEAYELEQKAARELNKIRKQRTKEDTGQQRRDESVIEQLRQELATEEELVQQSFADRQEAIRRQTAEGSRERAELEIMNEQAKNERLAEIQQQFMEDQRQREIEAAEERKQREIEELATRLQLSEEMATRLQEMADQGANAAQTLRDSWTGALLDVGDQFANTFARAIVQGENLGQAIKGVAQAFLTDMLASLIKVGARILINNAIANTAQATTAATSAATGAAIAAAYAPAAALVSLATLGANAGPAIAGITATSAVAQSAAAIPGLQLGGNMDAGQVRRIDEMGPEPVIFRDGARTFMQAGRNGAEVVPAGKGGGGEAPISVNVNVENQVQNAGFEVQSVDRSGTQVTINAIISDINNRGPVFRALERNTNVTGKANG